ncbi:MAG: GNAT family N-acetyltransferase [Rhodocyclaceae bacterium]|nr:GNAT family N-acetyltransferase [Rhodocyclaceae bacterium]
MASTTLRRAGLSEIDQLVTLINAAFRAEDFCVMGDRTSFEDIHARFQVGTFLVLEDAAAPGGLVGAVFTSITGTRAYLGLLSVDPAAQGRGISKVLIDAVEQNALAVGCDFLDITVVNVRENLFGYYEKLGFAPHRVAPFPVPEKARMPLHLVQMTKPLRPAWLTSAPNQKVD